MSSQLTLSYVSQFEPTVTDTYVYEPIWMLGLSYHRLKNTPLPLPLSPPVQPAGFINAALNDKDERIYRFLLKALTMHLKATHILLF